MWDIISRTEWDTTEQFLTYSTQEISNTKTKRKGINENKLRNSLKLHGLFKHIKWACCWSMT